MEYTDHSDWSVHIFVLVLGVIGGVLLYTGHWIASLPFLTIVGLFAILNLWFLCVSYQLKRMIGPGGPMSAEVHQKRMEAIFKEAELQQDN